LANDVFASDILLKNLSKSKLFLKKNIFLDFYANYIILEVALL
jgi:hypothetical protein